MIIALVIFISIVAIWEYRKRQKRIAAGELIPVPVTSHWVQAIILGLGILALIVLGINQSYGLPTALSAAYLIFIFIVPLFGGYILLRLIFAIIHRLER